jgi:hypothetical protein
MCAQALSQSSDALSCNEVSHHLMTWSCRRAGRSKPPGARGPWTGRPAHGETGRPAHGGGRVGGRADPLWGRPSRHPAADELGRLSPPPNRPAAPARCGNCTVKYGDSEPPPSCRAAVLRHK